MLLNRACNGAVARFFQAIEAKNPPLLLVNGPMLVIGSIYLYVKLREVPMHLHYRAMLKSLPIVILAFAAFTADTTYGMLISAGLLLSSAGDYFLEMVGSFEELTVIEHFCRLVNEACPTSCEAW